MKVLIAGAGHGGLAAAAHLARGGAEVTVIERHAEKNLGYDWTDIFNMACFEETGLPLPPEAEYHTTHDMTFFNPSFKTRIAAHGAELERCMERRDLLRHLIKTAREAGTAFAFETEVLEPLVHGRAVAGLAVRGPEGRREIKADVVIDAAGMDSPVRCQLPAEWNIACNFRRDQYFTIYRAFFNKTGAAPVVDAHFCVYFYLLNRRAITWVAREDDYVDLLCGSFGDTDRQYAEEMRACLRQRHPDMGDEIRRGGQSVKIPVRRPISRMVADGYAAIGDAAAMTVPLIGSGISNSIRAGRILADTLLAAPDFTTRNLWPYQVAYMQNIGAANAMLDILKDYIIAMKPEHLNFIFDHALMEVGDMVKIRIGQELSFTLPQLVVRGARGIANISVLLKMAGRLHACQLLKRQALKIPPQYDEAAVNAWAAAYDAMR